jgi:hypothetical protein
MTHGAESLSEGEEEVRPAASKLTSLGAKKRFGFGSGGPGGAGKKEGGEASHRLHINTLKGHTDAAGTSQPPPPATSSTAL